MKTKILFDGTVAEITGTVRTPTAQLEEVIDIAVVMH